MSNLPLTKPKFHTTRIQLSLDNWETYVAQLSTMPDKELEKKLDLIHLQSEIAIQKKNEESIELVEIWRAQVIEARILKAEQNIPDAPDEIEMAIAGIETSIAQVEDSTETMLRQAQHPDETQVPQRISKPKIQGDNNQQISLF